MSLPTITEDTTPAQLMDAIDLYVCKAEAILHEGDLPQLAGLDALVDALCKRVQSMSGEDGEAFADVLEALRIRLDTLQQTMTDMHHQTQEEIKALNARAKAARAYTKKKDG